MDILSLLVKEKVLDGERAAQIEKELQKPDASEEAVLQKNGVALPDILKAKSEYFGVPAREIGENPVPFDTLRYIPEESARHYKLVPLAIKDGVLEVGVLDPDNLEARDALTFISAKIGVPYKLFLISETDFERLLSQYKGLSGEVGKALTELETELITEAKEGEKDNKKISAVSLEEEITETETISEEAPVTKIVATILRH